MALTWREDRPEAITAASHSAVRPSRLMVTIFSALSSSSEVRMRFSRSLCGAGFGRRPRPPFAASWRRLLRGFLDGLFGGLGPGRNLFGCFRGLGGGLLRGFWSSFAESGFGSFAVRVRGFSMASAVAPSARSRSSVELSELRGPSSTTRDGADASRGATPRRRASPACKRRQYRSRPAHHRDRDAAGDVLPPPPAGKLFQIVAAHQPDEIDLRKALLQRRHGIDGVAGAQPGLDVGDKNVAVHARDCAPAAAAPPAHPARA